MTAQQFLQQDQDHVDYIVCDATLVRRDALDDLLTKYDTERIFLIQSVEEGIQVLKDIP